MIEQKTITETSKLAIYLNHLKNNRTEYLVLAVLLHLMGITDTLLNQTQGVCF